MSFRGTEMVRICR